MTPDGWTAAARDSIHKLLTGVVHLWLTEFYLRRQDVSRAGTRVPDGPSVFWVYSRHMEWGQDVLKGRRVRVTIHVEEDPS